MTHTEFGFLLTFLAGFSTGFSLRIYIEYMRASDRRRSIAVVEIEEEVDNG